MKPVIIIAIAFVLLIPVYAFADPHTIETVLDSGFSQDCVTDGCYTPSTVTVDVGHIITMTNGDYPSVHTFTSGTVDGFTPTPSDVFDSGILNPGESFEWSADTVGEYPYYCMLHTWMIGTIVVQEAEAEEEMMMEEEPEPKLPDWVRNIFVWYAEERISEDELLGAIQFLADIGIIKVN